MASLLRNERFPRSSNYDAQWLIEGACGANPLWLAEWLCEDLELKPGMRVLDLGCGRGKSSVFFAQEFGVDLWAVDLWFSPEENAQRVADHGLADRVTCLTAPANNLPFEFGFFDAIVAVDSIQYYGTDTLWLPYIVQLLKPGGRLGFASAGVVNEMRHPVPQHLERFWGSDAWCLRTAAWWREHWERTGLVDVQTNDVLADGWKHWLDWGKACDCSDWYLETIEKDAGQNLCYIRSIAQRSDDAPDLAYNLQTGEEQ